MDTGCLVNKMMPGMNPRKMNQMMKKMGISQQEIDATEVIIRTPEHDIVITNPSVSKVNMMGQQTYQIVGEETIQERSDEQVEILDEDVKTVMDQTGVNADEAKKAIADHNGDLAEAILSFKE